MDVDPEREDVDARTLLLEGQIRRAEGLYGPMRSGMRGIVLPPIWRNGDDSSFRYRADQEALVRRSLLYWDRIVQPRALFLSADFDAGHIERPRFAISSPDEEFLQHSGVLTVFDVGIPGRHRSPTVANDDVSRSLRLARDNVFYIYDGAQSDRWALCGSEEWMQPSDPQRSGNGIVLTLHNVLPSPSANTPFQEILEFKGRRRAELLALREALDELNANVLQSANAPFATQVAVRKVERALGDVHAAAARTDVHLVPTWLRWTIAGGLVPLGEATAGLAGSAGLLGPTVALAVGGAVGFLGFAVTEFKKSQPGAYTYVSRAKSEGIVPNSET